MHFYSSTVSLCWAIEMVWISRNRKAKEPEIPISLGAIGPPIVSSLEVRDPVSWQSSGRPLSPPWPVTCVVYTGHSHSRARVRATISLLSPTFGKVQCDAGELMDYPQPPTVMGNKWSAIDCHWCRVPRLHLKTLCLGSSPTRSCPNWTRLRIKGRKTGARAREMREVVHVFDAEL